jgi:hypothetical protein
VLASITGCIALDNDGAVPLSKEDLSYSIIFQKLEPNAVELGSCLFDAV